MGRIAVKLALNPVLGHSHTAYLIVRGIEAAAKGPGSLKANKRTTMASIFALPPDVPGNADRVFEVKLGLYQKYARGSAALVGEDSCFSMTRTAGAAQLNYRLAWSAQRRGVDLDPRDRKALNGLASCVIESKDAAG